MFLKYHVDRDDKAIVEGLIRGDEHILQQFFYVDCCPLFTSIINRAFDYQVDYDEFVNEFYIYLMGNDAIHLRQFQGRSSIYQWVKTVAIRFAMKLRKKGVMIDIAPHKLPYNKELPTCNGHKHAKMDIEALLSKMTNERQVFVIRRHLIDGIDEPTLAEEMGIKVSNLYNIKKRAMAALIKVALTDIQQYGKTNK